MAVLTSYPVCLSCPVLPCPALLTAEPSRNKEENYREVCPPLACSNTDRRKQIEREAYAFCRVLTGTSMATPHIAGIAALYLEAYPSAAAYQVKSSAISSAIPSAIPSAIYHSPPHLVSQLPFRLLQRSFALSPNHAFNHASTSRAKYVRP